ncbi:SemiSWEET family sugar transporter [Bdellovibrio sp. GT3]|uniref:SemiSWEET family sugar transporter n=1 Tax=Bdellovibrio sp. GT3 TaxID=3136282 RepID=UPI00404002D2
MESITALGLVAGVCTSLCGLPQVIKIYKTKSGKDVSYKTYIILSIGTALWIIYGIAKDDLAITITNSLNIAINFLLLTLKFKYQ